VVNRAGGKVSVCGAGVVHGAHDRGVCGSCALRAGVACGARGFYCRVARACLGLLCGCARWRDLLLQCVRQHVHKRAKRRAGLPATCAAGRNCPPSHHATHGNPPTTPSLPTRHTWEPFERTINPRTLQRWCTAADLTCLQLFAHPPLHDRGGPWELHEHAVTPCACSHARARRWCTLHCARLNAPCPRSCCAATPARCARRTSSCGRPLTCRCQKSRRPRLTPRAPSLRWVLDWLLVGAVGWRARSRKLRYTGRTCGPCGACRGVRMPRLWGQLRGSVCACACWKRLCGDC